MATCTRLGVVGPGIIWEQTHMPIIDRMEGRYEVAAFCVRNPEKTARWREKYPKAAAYTDYRAMVQDDGIDAVVVTTPLELNAGVTLAALAAGKDVFTEKPMAVRVADADAIIALQKQSGKRVCVLEQFLYNPQLPALRELVASGRLGALVSFERCTHYLMDAADPNNAYGQTSWRRRSDFPLGHIYDGGVHDVALLNALFGLPESIYAVGRGLREEMGKYDHILMLARYPGGVSGAFSHSAYLGCGSNYFYLRFAEGTVAVTGREIAIERKSGGTEILPVGEGDLYDTMWREMTRRIDCGQAQPFSLTDARDCVRFLDAVDRSIDAGRPSPV